MFHLSQIISEMTYEISAITYPLRWPLLSLKQGMLSELQIIFKIRNYFPIYFNALY